MKLQSCVRLAAVLALVSAGTPAIGQTILDSVDRAYDPVRSMQVRFPDEKVRDAQRALKDRGYDPGEIDGLQTARTQQAITGFQRDHGLSATGQLDAATTAALAGDDAPAAASPRMDEVQDR